MKQIIKIKYQSQNDWWFSLLELNFIKKTIAPSCEYCGLNLTLIYGIETDEGRLSTTYTQSRLNSSLIHCIPLWTNQFNNFANASFWTKQLLIDIPVQ